MIQLHDIHLGYGERDIIRSGSLHLCAGELCALVGRNGSGKSTLLRTLIGHLHPLSGRITLCGEELETLSDQRKARLISFVSTERVRIENMRCEDVVATGRAPYTNWIGRLQEEDREIVMQALRTVGMEAFASRSIDTLSDGECQRVMVARALAQQTPVILLDEPTAFLDVPTRFELCRLLKELAHTQGKCILFSTHDIDAALPSCDSMVIIDNGSMEKVPASHAKEVLATLFGM